MKNDELVLLVPLIEEEKSYSPSSGTGALLDSVAISMEQIDDLVEKFNNFKLEQIELHVKGAAKTGGVTQLLIGLSGEAGIKLVLKNNNI